MLHLHLCMVRFNKNEKENRNMREKVLAVCTRVNEKVDYTRTDLIDGGYIDSVTLVEIASELMDEFDIEIPYEEIMPENFNSIDAMTALVEKYV